MVWHPNLEEALAAASVRDVFYSYRQTTGWPAAIFQTCCELGVRQEVVYRALGWR